MAEPQNSGEGRAQSGCRLPCVMRVFNLIAAGILIGFGVAGIVLMSINSLSSGKFFLIFSPIFMALVGMLFIAAQFRVDCIMRHFVFLRAYFGRGVFNLFMASSVFFYFTCGGNDNTVVAWVAAIIIFVLGIFYIIAGTCLHSIFEPPLRPIKQDLVV